MEPENRERVPVLDRLGELESQALHLNEQLSRLLARLGRSPAPFATEGKPVAARRDVSDYLNARIDAISSTLAANIHLAEEAREVAVNLASDAIEIETTGQATSAAPFILPHHSYTNPRAG